jgi:peroxiredoxin Q/BCP
MRRLAIMTAGLCALTAGGGLTAGEKGKTMLKVGDKAPAFESIDENGQAWKSSDHVGKKIVVLYFFPAALTTG